MFDLLELPWQKRKKMRKPRRGKQHMAWSALLHWERHQCEEGEKIFTSGEFFDSEMHIISELCTKQDLKWTRCSVLTRTVKKNK